MTQDEATMALAQAIRDHAEAFDMTSDGEMLSDWAIIAAWVPVGGSMGETNYTTHFHNEEVPSHTAIGLFRTGELIVREDDIE